MPKQLEGQQIYQLARLCRATQVWVTDSKLGCLQVTSAATLHLFPAGSIIHPNPASKGSLLFILRGAVALQKAPPSDPPHTPAVAQKDHQSVGFTGSAAAAMHVPDAQAGINPQAAESDAQAAQPEQWKLVDDMSRTANLVNSSSAQPTMPDNTGRPSEVLSVTVGQSQASGKCTTGSQPANISHTSVLVDTVRGQSTSSQQSCLVDSAGGQSGLKNSAGGQSGLVDSAGGQSGLVDNAGGQSGLVDSAGGQSDLVDNAGGQSGRQNVSPEQRPALISDAQADKHEQALQQDVLDARGCAFGLPGLMLGEPLDARVAAKTVVEAYAIPWVLLQVLHTVMDSSECAFCNESI